MTLLLLLAACGTTPDTIGVDPGHNTDGPSDTGNGTTETEFVDGSIGSTARMSDGSDKEIENISFNATGASTINEQTVYVGDIVSGAYTISNVSGVFNNVAYTGCGDSNATINSANPDAMVEVSVNLTGTSWNVTSNGNTWEDAIIVNPDNACQLSLIGLNDGGEWINVEGHTFTWDSGHLIFTGVISDDAKTVTVTSTDGNVAVYTRE